MPMTYPVSTDLKCPACGAPVIIDEWSHTTADHEGMPDETIGTAHYCTNRICLHSKFPIDDDIL